MTSSGSLSEIAEISNLRQEVATRLATAGAQQNRLLVGNWSQNRTRTGASSGGSFPSTQAPAPPVQGQSDPRVPNFRQRIALRKDWVYCDKCGQWGKHKGNEHCLFQAQINSLRLQGPRNPPTSRLSNGQYDNSLYMFNISAGGWRDPSASPTGPPSTAAQGATSKMVAVRSQQPPRLRSEINVHPVVSFVIYVCSLFALPSSTASTRDGRPQIFGKVEDVDTDFLVNTGASLTVISKTLFRRLHNHWKLPQVEVPAGFRLIATSWMFPDNIKGFVSLH